ncbi:MAG: hypothetical protein Q9227_006072 [Pyrenula ochraceoflavens]
MAPWTFTELLQDLRIPNFESANCPSLTPGTISLSLDGKVALVTGGSKGNGAATALTFANGGVSVAINSSSDAGPAEARVSRIDSQRAVAIQGDACKVADIEKIVAATVQRLGKIEICLPNAGILDKKSLEAANGESFDRSYSLNVNGSYSLC